MADQKRLAEAVEEYITFRRTRVAPTTAASEAFVLGKTTPVEFETIYWPTKAA